MGDFITVLCMLSLCGMLYLEWRWRKDTKQVEVSERILAYRRKVRLIETFFILVFCSSLMYVVEYQIGMEISGVQSMFLVGALFGFSRTFFEPYYGVGVISDIEGEVLYLRSFDADRKSILKNRNAFARGSILVPEKIEKVKSRAPRNKVGPVFSIGDPNCASPTTQEALSIYVEDGAWKQAVAELAKKSRLILLRVGDTDGCRWEMAHCFEEEYLSKTLFVVDSVEGLRMLASHSEVRLPEDICGADLEKSSIGLFVDNEGNWRYRQLPSLTAVKSFIAEYLRCYPDMVNDGPSRKEIWCARAKSPWWERLSLLQNPVAYALYNGWRPWASITMIAYMFIVIIAVCTLCLVAAEDEEEYFVSVILLGLPLMFISAIPWLWFAPKYTAALNRWGSPSLAANANRTLAVWLFVFCVITVLLGLLYY